MQRRKFPMHVIRNLTLNQNLGCIYNLFILRIFSFYGLTETFISPIFYYYVKIGLFKEVSTEYIGKKKKKLTHLSKRKKYSSTVR